MEREPTSTATVISMCPGDSRKGDSRKSHGTRESDATRPLTIDLEPFAWESLEREAARLDA